jgi:hypothetical protein
MTHAIINPTIDKSMTEQVMDLSIVGLMIACVMQRSRSAASRWKATRLAAPCSLPLSAQTSQRPAKPARVTLR